MTRAVGPSDIFDCSGVAVVTGAASGFGLETARRCAAAGMRVALLDVDAAALEKACNQFAESAASPGQCAPIRCNVGIYDECAAAAQAVKHAFPDSTVTFLFNNAGIRDLPDYLGNVLEGTPSDSGWQAVFKVNVFGVVNILKVFAPGMVDAGPSPSGMKKQIVTTSSVMGLYDGGFGVNAYNASKMACTAICEQFHYELRHAGARAAHVVSHSLHPSMAGTNIFGDLAVSEAIMSGAGGASRGLSAADVIDALFVGIADGLFYIVVDDPMDKPAREQIRQRMESQMAGTPPRGHRPMAGIRTFQLVQEARQRQQQQQQSKPERPAQSKL